MIKFDSIFEPTLKQKLEDFLESGKVSSHITKALLVAAFFGGVLFVGAAAPNLFSALGRSGLGRKNKISKEGFYKLRRAFYKLRENKFIERVINKEGETVYRISKKGKKVLYKFSFQNLSIPEPKKWDGKWRIIIFDIPHTRKRARDALRERLIRLNCFRLQKSVWIHPFPCLVEIAFVANVFKVNSFVDVYTVEDFDSPKALKYFEEDLKEYL